MIYSTSRWSIVQILLIIWLLPILTAFCQENQKVSVADQIEPFISEAFALEMAPGMAVAVVQGDEIVYANGFGSADLETNRPVTMETMFYIASTTKSFTAFAAALLHYRGELNLDSPLSRYLPNLEFRTSLSADSITLRELLTHTHGIEDGGPVVFRTAFSGDHTPELLIDLLSEYKPVSTGKAFNYGNIGYNIASLAMDAALDIGWKYLLQYEIFDPLKMTHTSAYLSKVEKEELAMPYLPQGEGFQRLDYVKSDENMHAAGGHISSATDLAKWLIVHMNAGRIIGKQVFPEPVVAETHRKQADQDRDFSYFHRYGWGLGWDLGTYEGDTLLHRFGGFAGFYSHVSFMPDHGIGVVVLTNEVGLGSSLADLIACYIYDRLLNKPGLDTKYQNRLQQTEERSKLIRQKISENKAKRAARSQDLPHPLTAYVGTYENYELGRMDWQIKNERLEVRMGLLRSPAEVYDGEQNKFRIEFAGNGEVVKFSVDDEHAKSLIYNKRKFIKID
jgi:CubicO group peptidase (beta-lactamase class C family)